MIFSQYVVRVFWSLTPAPAAASQDAAQPKKRALAEGLRRASDRGPALGEALRRAQCLAPFSSQGARRFTRYMII